MCTFSPQTFRVAYLEKVRSVLRHSHHVNYLMNHTSLRTLHVNMSSSSTERQKAAVKLVPCGLTAGRMEIYNFLCLCTSLLKAALAWITLHNKRAGKIKAASSAQGTESAVDFSKKFYVFIWNQKNP